MRKHLSRIGIVVALLAAPAWSQEKKAQLVPLVQLKGDEFVCQEPGFFGFGGRYCIKGAARERSVTVFRSGRVIAIETGADEAAQDPAGAVYTPIPSTVNELQASRRSIVDLIAFLNSQVVAGGITCNPLSPSNVPGVDGLSFSRYSIVWFQTDGRRDYAFLDNTSTRRCPPRIAAIFDAIVAFGETGTRTADAAEE
jgi:hypothetical protein